jgi:hypothetical protein
LEGEAAKVGLKINEQKTKYMNAARKLTLCDVGQSDKHFEAVKELVYLESLMTPTNDVSLEVQRRIQIGASSDCANICSRATFHARPNSPFQKTLIRSVLLYGNET